jgi:cell shape-determining protein MreD
MNSQDYSNIRPWAKKHPIICSVFGLLLLAIYPVFISCMLIFHYFHEVKEILKQVLEMILMPIYKIRYGKQKETRV